MNIFSNHFQRCYKTEFWKYAAALVVLHFSMDQFPQFAAHVQIKLYHVAIEWELFLKYHASENYPYVKEEID